MTNTNGNVHHAVVGLAGQDARELDESETPQVALGLGQDGGVIGIAGPEEQKLSDDGRPRDDMHRVGGAVEPSPRGFRRREHVQAFYGDGADFERLVASGDEGREAEKKKCRRETKMFEQSRRGVGSEPEQKFFPYVPSSQEVM